MPRPFLRAGSVRFFGFSERYEVLLKGQPPAERIFMLQPLIMQASSATPLPKARVS